MLPLPLWYRPGTGILSARVLLQADRGHPVSPSSPFARQTHRRLDATGSHVPLPREVQTSELTIVPLDLRHVIDALFFRSGPMSEGVPSNREQPGGRTA
jgi:hypothetical protein